MKNKFKNLELIINNCSYYTNTEFYTVLCRLDNRYLNCKEGFEVSKKDNQTFINGLKKLNQLGLIKLEKSETSKLKIIKVLKGGKNA